MLTEAQRLSLAKQDQLKLIRHAENLQLHSRLIVHELKSANDREMLQVALRSIISHAMLIGAQMEIDVLPPHL